MKCQYLQNQFQILAKAINTATKYAGDPDISYMLSGHLTVLISGIYEDCVEYLFISRAGKTKDKAIESLVKTLIDQQFRNPDYDKIQNLLKGLGPTYANQFKKAIGSANKDALNSIVMNKNLIAHGNPWNTTLNDVVEFHKKAQMIFEVLEKILE
jgi:hypothetical protein